MKKFGIILLILNSFLFFLNGEATKTADFSGFFDLNFSTYKNEPNIFSIGEFEFDIEKSFSDRISMEAAFVINGHGEAEVAVGLIDFQLTDSGIHFAFGKFDVSFGNDTPYYASIDRTTVSAPLTTEIILDGGLNDLGISLYKESDSYTVNAYVLRGNNDGFMAGGRLGFSPVKEKLSLGLSYIYDVDQEGNKEETFFAADAEFTLGSYKLRGEYLKGDIGIKMDGFHIIGYYNTEKFTPYLRYGYVKTDEMKLDRISAGIKIMIIDAAIFKFEYQHYIDSDSDEFEGSSFFGQLVITF